MGDLLVLAAHNTAVALVMALFVYALARVWRNPPVIHLLWLVVLLKLVAAAAHARRLVSTLVARTSPTAGRDRLPDLADRRSAA